MKRQIGPVSIVHSTPRVSLQYIYLYSKYLSSALLNWCKKIYGPFGQSNMHRTLDFCPDQPGRESNVPKLRNKPISYCPNIYTGLERFAFPLDMEI